VVAVDTSTAGEYEDTVTVDSDGGTATVRVKVRVDPRPAACLRGSSQPEGASTETPVTARSGPQRGPALATASPAHSDEADPRPQPEHR
jgi:hypothetical protein